MHRVHTWLHTLTITVLLIPRKGPNKSEMLMESSNHEPVKHFGMPPSFLCANRFSICVSPFNMAKVRELLEIGPGAMRKESILNKNIQDEIGTGAICHSQYKPSSIKASVGSNHLQRPPLLALDENMAESLLMRLEELLHTIDIDEDLLWHNDDEVKKIFLPNCIHWETNKLPTLQKKESNWETSATNIGFFSTL